MASYAINNVAVQSSYVPALTLDNLPPCGKFNLYVLNAAVIMQTKVGRDANTVDWGPEVTQPMIVGSFARGTRELGTGLVGVRFKQTGTTAGVVIVECVPWADL